MSNITAENIKLLREKTGAGMMDCKKALIENEGNIENSISWLRKKGIAKAEKKSSRVASQGLVGVKIIDNLAVMVEINSETDFVSKNSDFQNFLNNILVIGVKKKYTLEGLLNVTYEGTDTVGSAIKNLIAKIGENIVIRRLIYLECEQDTGIFGSYIHNKINNNMGKMACIVKVLTNKKNDSLVELANKIAMHTTACKPVALDENSIDNNLLKKEKEIFESQLKSSGKPEGIIEKIVNGKIKKYLSEVTLINQNWVLDPSISVKEHIELFNKNNDINISIAGFELLILGEGVEVEEKSFSEEVASQINNTT